MNTQHLSNEQIYALSNKPGKREILKRISFKEDLAKFKIKDGKIHFIEHHGAGFNEKSNDVFVNKIKIFLKKTPWVFSAIYHLIGLSFVGKSPTQAIENVPRGKIIINLGSGIKSIRSDVINVDFYPFKNVDFVVDIANLPFADETIDAVICEHVLEHVSTPKAVISEIYRTMKPGAIVYVVIPFVMSFHSSPYDYYRWSKMGLEQQFNDFQKIDSGIRSGSGAAVDYVLAEYLGTLFSFGLKKLQQILFVIFLVLFAPLCWLDYLIYRFPTSENIAQHFYYIGRKK